MNRKQLDAFFELFGLNQEERQSLMGEGMIVEQNGHLFLTQTPFSEEQVAGGIPLFIMLKQKVVAARPLLDMIYRKVTGLEVRTRKQALQFTYGKSLSRQLLEYEGDLVDQRYYLITINKRILGYAQYDHSAKKLYNKMHVGEYLKET
jgi:hypothetical protein